MITAHMKAAGRAHSPARCFRRRAALLLGPINPRRNTEKSALRFRSARLQGYGASSGMVRRCLERLDDAGITGSVSILRALCETRPVATQGPQWVEDGKHF